jgi:hypothetical protein
MTRRGRAIPKNEPAKRWVAIFALLAFFLQGMAVESHVHQLIQPGAAKTTSLPATTPLKSPLKIQDPLAQCRWCQELVDAGTFVTPTAASIPADLSFVTVTFAGLPAIAGAAASPFVWQSRAPPHH